MKPKLADIWEWTVERWTEEIGDYAMLTIPVLILTKPTKKDDHWRFKGLALDGPEPGVVEDWNMWDDPGSSWRQLA